MNKIYRVIWNTQLGCWQAVSELAKNHNSSSQTSVTSAENDSLKSGLGKLFGSVLLFSFSLLPLSIHAAISSTELPTGAQINSGSASFIQNNNTLNINQNSQNLSTNWNTFNIGQDATVNFNQPNHSSTAINHVLDSNASQIMGRLNANGQVFLLNPNGVVFSKTAQVNVGGLVASTLNLNDADIQNGKFTLKGDPNSRATIENQGSIQTLKGGTVALIAPNVKNTGSIVTLNGTTHLTSASQVTLALQNGSLTQYQVDQGVLQGLVDNGGAIIADNGAVYLTAKAKDSLSKAVVNHSGIIEANRLSQNAKGEIILLGDMQTGETHVSGTLKAEGKNGQDGGFIETSAAKVNIDKDIKISTLSEGGKTGNWLIDPYNVVISNNTDNRTDSTNFTASQDDTVINATMLTAALATTGVTVSTGGTGVGTQDGNITVDADLSWTSNSTLTLQADKDINLNKKITAQNGGLTLNATNNISATDAINVGTFTLSKGNWLQNMSTLPSFYAKDFRLNGGIFIRALGGDGSTASPLKLTDIYGVQGMGTKLSGNFVLADDIDASGTVNWNGGNGFNPIGNSLTSFTGVFDGLGHTINGLTINRPSANYVGLLGQISSATIKNIGLMGGTVTGAAGVGGLVGINWYGTISNVYTTSTVTGTANSGYVGGLVGANWYGSISNTYATGSCIGGHCGGLVGGNYGTISNAYAIGMVNGITTSGGLVGYGSGTISNSFWNTEITGQLTSVGGGTGLTTAQIFDQSNLTGFDFGSVWGNANNQTTPYLLGLANNQVFNKNDLPTGTITSTNRPALYTAILNVNQLQNMNQNLSGKYLLGNNIDASDTVNWNSGAGFNPIGNPSATFKGVFDGLNHTVNGLTINRQTIDYVGLFGYLQNAKVQNLGLVVGSIKGQNAVGAVAGWNTDGSIVDSVYSTVQVEGLLEDVGGLVGRNISGAIIKNSYSNGSVKGKGSSGGLGTGGLVGANYAGSIIENSYATGSVTGISGAAIGGLVGDNAGIIRNSYASGNVIGTAGGGLIGFSLGGQISNSFWNSETSGKVVSSGGGIGLTTAQMQNLSTFTTAGWNIDDIGGTGKIWRIYEGQTAPLLRSFLTTLDLNTISKTTTYNGLNQTLATVNGLNNNLLVSSGVAGGRNVGDYTTSHYSNQFGYDLIGNSTTLTINPADLILTTTDITKTYDGTKSANGTVIAANGTQLFNTDSLSGGTFEFADKNAGLNKVVNVSGVTIDDGNNGNNYNVSYVDNTKSSILKAVISAITGISANHKTYDGMTAATLNTGSAGFTGIVAGDDLNVATSSANFIDKNAGTGKTVNITGLSLGGTDAGNYTLASNTATTKANITPATLIAGLVAQNKVYDGNKSATASFTDNRIGTDDVQVNGIASFSDKNVANGKTVTANGLSLSGADAGNYVLAATTVTDTADITKAKISQVSGITAHNRVYDATTNATLNTSSAQFNGIVAGDQLTAATATGQFSDKNVGTAKQVSISNISLNGADAHNYELVNSTAQTTADISKANINNITGITADNRAYNGLTAISLNSNDAQFNGMYAGDDLSVATATGQFDTATTGQAKTVSITGLSLGGADAQNYNLIDTTALTAADINMLTPANYLQAIQLRRPRYLPETNNELNTVDLDVRQGGVNTSGIQALTGEY